MSLLRTTFYSSQFRLVAPLVASIVLFIAVLFGLSHFLRDKVAAIGSQEQTSGQLVGYFGRISTELYLNHNDILLILNTKNISSERIYESSSRAINFLEAQEEEIHSRQSELAAQVDYFPAFHAELHNYRTQITSALELVTHSHERAEESIRLATTSMLRLQRINQPGMNRLHQTSYEKTVALLSGLAQGIQNIVWVSILVLLPLSALVIWNVWRITRAILSPLNRVVALASNEMKQLDSTQTDILQAMPILEQALSDLRNYRENRLHTLQTALDSVPIAVQIVRLDHRVEYVNDAYLREHHADRRDVVGAPASYLRLDRSLVAAIEARQARKIGYRPALNQWREIMLSFVLDEAGNAQYAVLLDLDISEQKRLENDLTRMVNNDSLTDLANRRYFNSQCILEVERASRYRQSLSLILLDIDHFKRVNDTYGHPVGDLVIQALSMQCRDVARNTDLAARIGGEEFALLLPNTELEGARILAERLRTLAENLKVPTANESVRFSISVGVGQIQSDESMDTLFSRVDEALYAAKRGGRNRVALSPFSQ